QGQVTALQGQVTALQAQVTTLQGRQGFAGDPAHPELPEEAGGTTHQDQSSFNQNYLQQPMPNLKDITDPTTAMNMALALMAKAFMLNYSTPTNNNKRISSNLRKRQIAQLGMNMGQDRQMQIVGGNGNQNQIGNGNLVAARAEGNAAGQNGNQIRCYNCRGGGHYARNCTVRPRRRDAVYLQTQLVIAQKEEVGIQLQAEEYDLMAAVANLDEIKEVNANCILMANLQQASTSGTNPRVQNVGNQNGLIGVQGNGNQNPTGSGNLVAVRAEGNAAGHIGNQIRCYKCRGVGHFSRDCTVRLRRRDAAYLQTQLLIAQKEEAGIQLQAEEYDLMAAAADLDEIEEVNANCILMANLQQASSSGTQTDSAPVYDYDGSTEEAAKFVGEFKSLTNEADASLAKHKALELEIERLLKVVVS
nr:hypothetical protein [Tanacetum cinerariifolium]